MADDRVPVDPMPCADARELVSAAADDELLDGEGELLDAHLEGCPSCRAHAEQVAVLTRTMRLRPAGADTDIAARVLARSGVPRLGRGGWTRPALVWIAVVIAIQSFDPLVFGRLDGTPTHVARHVGASGLALAIGLLYAAWRPHRAFGLLPLVGALFAATAAAALLDTITGDRPPSAEVVHVAEVAGMVLLWFVAGSPGWERLVDGLRSLRRDGGVPHPTS